MNRKYILVLTSIAFSVVSCTSGAGSGSDDVEYHENTYQDQATETVIHEISGPLLPDLFDNTEHAPSPDRPCVTNENCGVTEAPSPTRILSLHIVKDSNTKTDEQDILKKRRSTENTTDSYQRMEMGDEARKILQTILDKVSKLEKDHSSYNFALTFLETVNSSLRTMQVNVNQILTSLASLNRMRKPEPSSQANADLVATETWSYIDSKLTELKSNLLAANQRINRDLEDKMDTVLSRYDSEFATKNIEPILKRDFSGEMSEEQSTPEMIKAEGKNGRSHSMCQNCCNKSLQSVSDELEDEFGKIYSYTACIKFRKKMIEHIQRAGSIEVGETLSICNAPLAFPTATIYPVSFTEIQDISDTSPLLPNTAELKGNFESAYLSEGGHLITTARDVLHDRTRYTKHNLGMYDAERVADGVKRSNVETHIAYHRSDRRPASLEASDLGEKESQHKIVFPKDCAEIYEDGERESGVYLISPLGREPWKVYCDMETNGGGWTIMQRRTFGNVNFTRKWDDYKQGFGLVTGDFWLGLQRMHILTKLVPKRAMTLRIDLKDWSDVSQYAQYNSIEIAGERLNYRLTLNDYHGTAGNAMQYTPGGIYNHNGQRFTTYDQDNDRYRLGNCGKYYGSGWWFNSCFAANLNGKYYRGTYRGIRDGIYWGTWYRLSDAQTNSRHSFKYVDMKVRPADFLAKKLGGM